MTLHQEIYFERVGTSDRLIHIKKSNNPVFKVFLIVIGLLILIDTLDVWWWPEDTQSLSYAGKLYGGEQIRSTITLIVCGIGLTIALRRLLLPRIILYLLLMQLYAAISFIWALQPYSAAVIGFRSFLLTLSVLFFVDRITLNQFNKILFYFIFLVASMSLISALYYPSLTLTNGVLGWRGLFNHKNALGSFTVFSLMWFVLHWRKIDIMFFLRAIFIFLLIGLLVLSQSKTSIACLILFLCLYCLTLGCLFVFRASRIVALSFMLILAIPCVVMIFQHPEWIYDRVDLTFTGRTRAWEFYLGKFWDRPLFGHGTGYLTGDDITSEALDRLGVVSVHNSLLDGALQWGVVGILMQAGILLLVLTAAFRCRDRHLFAAGLAFGLASAAHATMESLTGIIMSSSTLYIVLSMASLAVSSNSKVFCWNGFADPKSLFRTLSHQPSSASARSGSKGLSAPVSDRFRPSVGYRFASPSR